MFIQHEDGTCSATATPELKARRKKKDFKLVFFPRLHTLTSLSLCLFELCKNVRESGQQQQQQQKLIALIEYTVMGEVKQGRY